MSVFKLMNGNVPQKSIFKLLLDCPQRSAKPAEIYIYGFKKGRLSSH